MISLFNHLSLFFNILFIIYSLLICKFLLNKKQKKKNKSVFHNYPDLKVTKIKFHTFPYWVRTPLVCLTEQNTKKNTHCSGKVKNLPLSYLSLFEQQSLWHEVPHLCLVGSLETEIEPIQRTKQRTRSAPHITTPTLPWGCKKQLHQIHFYWFSNY